MRRNCFSRRRNGRSCTLFFWSFTFYKFFFKLMECFIPDKLFKSRTFCKKFSSCCSLSVNSRSVVWIRYNKNFSCNVIFLCKLKSFSSFLRHFCRKFKLFFGVHIIIIKIDRILLQIFNLADKYNHIGISYLWIFIIQSLGILSHNPEYISAD